MSGPQKRIVFLTEDSKPATGGVAEYLHQLALATSTMHDVLVITSVAGADALNETIPFRYRHVPWFRSHTHYRGDDIAPVRRINTLAWLATRQRRVRELLREIAAEAGDSTFVLGRVSPVTAPWLVACRALGIPCAALAYGREILDPAWPRAAAQEISRWYAISGATLRMLVAQGVPESRVTVLRPGVAVLREPGEHLCDVRTQLGVGKHPFVLSVCMLRLRKGIDLAIRAFAELAPEFPDLRYVVAGDGPERDRLLALAETCGIRSLVTFVGEVDDSARDALFGECELFVMPTRRVADDTEGFGLVFLEAARAGKPAIGGRYDGVPEAIVDGVTGLLVDTDRGEGPLVAAMRLFLADPQLAAAYGARARQRVHTEFTWDSRARAFAARLDTVSRGEQESAPGTRVGRAALWGRTHGVVAARLAARGRLLSYLRAGRVPRDLSACRSAVLGWVSRAARGGGGGALPAGYHVVDGWGQPYPEVTGYLIPTLLRESAREGPNRVELTRAATRAGEWLLRTRLPNGAVCRKQWHPGAAVPSVFNTAQVLEGWCALAMASGESRWLSPARDAAAWLLSEQEPDGSWVRSAFNGVSHSYYARAASALAKFARLADDERSAMAARRAFEWVLAQQDSDGWFDRADFTPGGSPTTHTIGYVLEGLLEGADLLDEPRYRAAAAQAAGALRGVRERVGYLPGRFACGWRPAAKWRCVTGDAQMGLIWAMLGNATGDERWMGAARAMADSVRGCVRTVADWPEISGGVPGSAPTWAEYDAHAYPTHAAKFALDLFALTAA